MVTRLAAEEPVLRGAFQEIVATPSDDVFAMTLVGIKPLVQAHMNYPCFRATIEIRLMNGKMHDRLQIDLGVGDLVTPAKRALGLLNHRGHALFEESISLLVYPVETIYAEKLETVISKGGLNSRMKDFHDLLLMGRQNGLMELDRLGECVRSTFAHRGTELQLPIDFIAPGWVSLQSHWDRHIGTVLGKGS